MSTPPILTLIQRGNEFPRFIIAKGDILRNPVYWDSENKEWHQDENKATVYANQTDALWEHHYLIMESLKGLPCHTFVAPIYIDIYGEKPDIEAIREWLEKAVRIVLNSPQFGDGPIKDSVGLLVADFGKIKKK